MLACSLHILPASYLLFAFEENLKILGHVKKEDPAVLCESGIMMGIINKLNPFRLSSQVHVRCFLAQHLKLCVLQHHLVSLQEKTSEQRILSTDVKPPTLEDSQMNVDVTRMPDHLKSSVQDLSGMPDHQKSSSRDLGGMPDHQKYPSQSIPDLHAAGSDESDPLLNQDDEDDLTAWWKDVEGWSEWSESKEFSEEDGEWVVAAAAERCFLAAQLFLQLFSSREPRLLSRIQDLRSVADAADTFHRRAVTASVGGGAASVAGGVASLSGLILAPFTFGTSLIVTAVGIGVATAGGVTSASASITETVHANTDRKRVEKIIRDYQEDIGDIKECLDFLQAGLETLESWSFQEHLSRLSSSPGQQDLSRLLKESGRAGKALVVNTESLISTVQALSAAGGAARAAQAISVSTGVMSGLFLALDVFFLTRGTMELRRGAKSAFAGRLREVCGELEEGVKELRRIQELLMEKMNEEEED
ncbi:hypothetical protein DNTS_012036 [Danionella cerebrum]|uniref:Uncharacterized protein n=1 Tax=Danionella cerebrum TaxID=2873325 RepID=A0A553MX72_9TELE|nr:hypothetical protein DNTS_012036 [Danionella translucida]